MKLDPSHMKKFKAVYFLKNTALDPLIDHKVTQPMCPVIMASFNWIFPGGRWWPALVTKYKFSKEHWYR